MYGQYQQRRGSPCPRADKGKRGDPPSEKPAEGKSRPPCQQGREVPTELPKAPIQAQGEEAQGKTPCQQRREDSWELPKAPQGASPFGGIGNMALPGFLQNLLPKGNSGDLLALLILLLLLSEGREDAHNTILTLLIFLLL